jgi:hypothetical protein
MQDVTAKLVNKTSNQRKPLRSSDQHIALHLRYGKIGIPAVAAAARSQSGGKNFLRSPDLSHPDSPISLLHGECAMRRSPDISATAMKNSNDAVDGSSARHLSATDVGAGKAPHDLEELPMQML